MPFFAFGINHHSAPVEIRERVAFEPTDFSRALVSLAEQEGIGEAVILSTCNRTELYCAAQSPLSTGNGNQYDSRYYESVLASWLTQFHGISIEEIKPYTFFSAEQEAVNHVMSVAAGLDSLVLGETQILGQLKSAYESAAREGVVGTALGRMIETSFSVAKQVRTETAIGENPVSVAAAAVNLAKQLFDDFSDKKALLIGAGKTTELVARHLKQAGVQQMTIANRTLARAQELAEQVEANSALLGDIPDLLVGSDIVIASTASTLPILGKGAVERALKLRKHRPIFMVDIAVPRDIEPQVAELDDVYLYTVDDMKQVIDQSLKSRQSAALEARDIIEKGCEQFLNQMRASNAGSVLKDFRSHAEGIQQEELAKALNALQGGADPQKVLQNLSRTLTNKLIHEPTMQVKHSVAQGEHDAEFWLRRLFGLEK